jgi:hypothetical protein
MPRSNSSRGVAEGGSVLSAAVGRADAGLVVDRHLPTTERPRRTGGVRILRGIEGIAAAAVTHSGRRRFLHDRRGGCDLRLLIAALLLRIRLLRRRLLITFLGLLVSALLRIGRLPVAGIGLRRRHRGDARLSCRRRRARCCGRRGTELAQPVLELAVAVLQFLVLAGDLAKLVLQPLDAHLEVDILGQDRKNNGLRSDGKHRGGGHGAADHMKSG